MLTRPRTAVRRLAVARAISTTGDVAQHTAMTFYLYARTGSAGWVAAGLLATFGVTGLLSPLSGWVGDRFDRRRVMIVSDVVSAACAVGLALVRSPGALVAVGLVGAIAQAPFWPASSAAIPSLAGKEDLAWANGLVSVGSNAGILTGPIIGGLLVASIGAPAAFLTNAASFVLSAAMVVTVRGRFRQEAAGDEQQGGTFAGFSAIRSDPVLLRMTVAFAIAIFGLGVSMVADAPVARLFGVGSVGYGLLIAAWGAGSIAGSLAGRRLSERSEPRAAALSMLAVAVGLAVAAVSPVFWLLPAGFVVAGGGDALAFVAQQGIVQRRTPDAIRSRTLAAFDAFSEVGLAASFVAGGAAVAAVGPRAAYGFNAAFALLGALLLVRVARAVLRTTAPAPDGAAPAAVPSGAEVAGELER